MANKALLAAVSFILLLSISLASSCGDDGGANVKRSQNFGSQSPGTAGVARQSSSVSSGNLGASEGAPAADAAQAQRVQAAGRKKRSPNFGAPSHPSQSNKGLASQGQSSQAQSNVGQPNRGQSTRGQPTRGQSTRGQPTRGQSNQGQPSRGQSGSPPQPTRTG